MAKRIKHQNLKKIPEIKQKRFNPGNHQVANPKHRERTPLLFKSRTFLSRSARSLFVDFALYVYICFFAENVPLGNRNVTGENSSQSFVIGEKGKSRRKFCQVYAVSEAKIDDF